MLSVKNTIKRRTRLSKRVLVNQVQINALIESINVVLDLTLLTWQ